MDRNIIVIMILIGFVVALRKESVDRNFAIRWNTCEVPTMSLSARRAWIEMPKQLDRPAPLASLSARRAWIEMSIFRLVLAFLTSLSARRAWIEIPDQQTF